MRRAMAIAFVAMLGVAGAEAHVTIDVPRAPAGSSQKLAFRVGHGCDGSATRLISVRMPAGLRGAKPMPKPGWAITVRRAALAQPYESHGHRVDDEVAEVTWTARNEGDWLPDAYYDEFVLRAQLPDAAGPLWFKVRQVCERGETDWADVPASGTSTRDLKAPAALLEVLPGEAAAHAH